jgi:hypothetical protein
LELRRQGAHYREIASKLGVGIATAYGDVQAELVELRDQTKHEAEDLRDLELQRCDVMVNGLWDGIRGGDPRSVMAAVRVSERRARLLGIDAPVQSTIDLKAQIEMRTKGYWKRLTDVLEDDEVKRLLMTYETQKELIDVAKARLEARGDR